MNNSKTMNNTFRWILILIASVCFISCTQEVFNEDVDGDVSSVIVIGPDDVMFEDASTRGTEITPSDVLRFSWSQGDTLGIFPDQGNQVEFPITSSDGSTSAVFNGGGWALKNLSTYAAYYPFSVWNYHRNNKKILLDYSGQVQNGNGSFEHLSAYDFLASSKTAPTNNEVTFQMNRQGSILYIDIVVPDPCSVYSLVVSCDEEIFVEQATLDISGDAPSLNPVKMTKELTLQFTGVTTTQANENVRAYMAVSPVDFTNKTVTATLYTDLGSYSAPVVSRKVEQGKAAFLRFAEDFTYTIIEFEDAEVKRLCVANWDTDGDGELSHDEAAAVTDLGTIFRNNTIIQSFNELSYFKGLTAINSDAFFYCTGLQEITLPNSITSIGRSAFRGCESLQEIALPSTITSIGDNAFSRCTMLSSIIFPENLINIGADAFYLCTSLSNVTINGSGITIGSEAFASCTSLSNVTFNGSDITIRGGAFSGCISLADFSFEGITYLGGNAFAGCLSLDPVITIPNSVEQIGRTPFAGCTQITRFEGKYADETGQMLYYDVDWNPESNVKYVCQIVPGIVNFTMPDGVYYLDCPLGDINTKSIMLPTTVGIGYGSIFEVPENVESITFGNGFDYFNMKISALPVGCKIYSEYASSDNSCLIIDNQLIAFSYPQELWDNHQCYKLPDNITFEASINLYSSTAQYLDCYGLVFPSSVVFPEYSSDFSIEVSDLSLIFESEITAFSLMNYLPDSNQGCLFIIPEASYSGEPGGYSLGKGITVEPFRGRLPGTGDQMRWDFLFDENDVLIEGYYSVYP